MSVTDEQNPISPYVKSFSLGDQYVETAGSHPLADPENIFMVDFESNTIASSPGFEPAEVAVIVLDKNLNEIASFGPKVFAMSEAGIAVMNDYVLNMHTTSGLMERMQNGPVFTADQIDNMLHSFLIPFFPAKGSVLENGKKFRGAVIGGNSVSGVDVPALDRFLPMSYNEMDYRVLDVSAIGEAVKRFLPEIYEAMPSKVYAHEAMGDIRESVKELRYYREHAFVSAA